MPSGSEYAFDLLATQSASLGSMRVRDSEVSVSAGTVLHGIDAHGLLHILVPLRPDEKPQADERSAGVQIVPITLDAGNDSRKYLDIVCRLSHLNPLFCGVADEMLEAMQAEPDRAELACQIVLDRWRELLERRRTKLLGPEQLMGLLGELLVLEQLALRNPGLALSAWKGPEGHRFDFVFGTRAFEVKSSTSRERRSVQVHGDRQLEPLPGGELYLIYIRLESRSEGGETVPRVVDRLMMMGTPRLILTEALERAGYLFQDRGAYERIGFDVLENLTYSVADEFPRIIPASFLGGSTPAGVSHLRYHVDLSGPTPVPLEGELVRELFDRFLTTA